MGKRRQGWSGRRERCRTETNATQAARCAARQASAFPCPHDGPLGRAAVREGTRRHASISPLLAGLAEVRRTGSARPTRRWVAWGGAAEPIHGFDCVGPLPPSSQRGNRRRKLPKATLTIVDEFLAD